MTYLLLLNPFTNLTKEVIIRHKSERRLWKALGYIIVVEKAHA